MTSRTTSCSSFVIVHCPPSFVLLFFSFSLFISVSSFGFKARSESRANLFSDESDRIGLGDNTGITLAVGDFTSDRATDLLATDISLRVVHVHEWAASAFHRAGSFSLDDIDRLSKTSTIVSAATFDANADGQLDALLSVQVGKKYIGVLLAGDGRGGLSFLQLLPELAPNVLVLDANGDMLTDLFYVNEERQRVFYINNPPGNLTRRAWSPDLARCQPLWPHSSNAFVDVDGDCLPDLVVSSSCGLEVWRHSSHHEFAQAGQNRAESYIFSNVNSSSGPVSILDASVWSPHSGDGRATFADFNGDGTIDIAVPNVHTRQLRISYGIRDPPERRVLCSPASHWHFRTIVAYSDFLVNETNLDQNAVQSGMSVGDFNYDGKLDILALDSERGTINLLEAERFAHKSVKQKGKPPNDNIIGWFVRSFGWLTGASTARFESVRFHRYSESLALQTLEDPIAASFFDTGERGRQDILVVQRHGTRLLMNNYSNVGDVVYFKTTSVNAAHNGWKSPKDGEQAFAPLPGNTFKISYHGRQHKETRVCSQCPQSGILSLQSCSCLFGITKIANYIEQMDMGGAEGVKTWHALMPNALAVIWPKRPSLSSHSPRIWKISYVARGRDRQMKLIVLVLCISLVVLLFAILYVHRNEKLEASLCQVDIG